MFKKIITGVAISASFINIANAQLSVSSESGTVRIGLRPPANIISTGQDDPDNVLAGHVYGPNGDFRAGSKLAFGDFGSYPYGGWNVFVGEYSDNDVDQLWLHGKRGTYLTWGGQAENTIGYYDVNYGNVFHFNCDVYSYGIALASDARFKTNVQNLENAVDQLKKLRGVSYNLMPHVLNVANRSGSGAPINDNKPAAKTGTSGTQKKDAALDMAEKNMSETGPKRIGLIAQEVQKVFPELVKEDSTNYLYVDYIGLIPVIIEGVKEQEALIEAQNAKIKELESEIGRIDARLTGMETLSVPGANDATGLSVAASFLYQNTPNPFSEITQINYFVVSGVKASAINIFDMQGKLIKTIALKGTGKGSISISASELMPGMYIYNLITDGQEADVKRMTIMK